MSDSTFMCRCKPVENIFQNAKPIIFNTEMTKVILENRKTVTRRVIKPRSPKACGFCVARNKQDGSVTGVYDCDEHGGMFDAPQKPPYSPGDILYVRETWDFRPDNELGYIYRADYKGPYTIKWRPSIHMPREAARIFLRVTDVRVERLQDMNMNDVQADGVVPDGVKGGQWQQWQRDYMKPVWDSTIKPKDRAFYGWDANPYVWCVLFERISEDEAYKRA